ncbi:COX15/CtaA family protein [Actinoplanes xinjiangensis]|uniref:Cytochrome c oxidase assembly protein subunit 15 n=1 Tax=Actinoplanes xinjiangensis TaxID=512350 RepID=A0A316F4W1_9ACTN|nr:COX15/CtaA family protein [Actinoplanes xinjiangensis]PWK31654.1 cytochrome c oxidase assembly protein subunit 15 [Actinoplanes xinjiangensis]
MTATMPTRRAGAAVAALVANTLIVLTGALVRLTGSGLGCPTWPRCTSGSFVTTAEMGVHGVVEFGNRMLGIVVGLVTLTVVVVLLRDRNRPRWSLPLAIGVLAGVGVQGMIGGLSVRRALAPEIVAGHFLASMILIAALTVLIDLLRRPHAAFRLPADPWTRLTVVTLPVVLTTVLILGTLVTGSGPHAGDDTARRLGLDAAVLTTAHAVAVLLLVGVQAASLLFARAARPVRRAALMLLAVTLVQGVIGSVQNTLALPVPMVAAHVVTAALIVIAATHLVARAVRTTGDRHDSPEGRT